jgi:hypothetical protein
MGLRAPMLDSARSTWLGKKPESELDYHITHFAGSRGYHILWIQLVLELVILSEE